MGKHSSKHSKKSNRHVLPAVIVAVLLATIIGFGCWLGVSFKRAGDYFAQARDEYAQVDSCIEDVDYRNAVIHAREAATYASKGSAELQGVQWDIAAKIPVLGSDVATMRSIGTISGTLSDKAVLPTLDAIDELMGDGSSSGGTFDLSMVSEKIDQVVELAATLQEADKVVDECSAQANSLPTSRIGAVNSWADSLKGAITSINSMLDNFVGVAKTVTSMSGAMNSILGSSEQA